VDAGVFALRQNLEAYDFAQLQLAACDQVIEVQLQRLVIEAARATTPRQAAYRNAPRFDVRAPLYQLSGADLSQLDGIRRTIANRDFESVINKTPILRTIQRT
jgi:transposase